MPSLSLYDRIARSGFGCFVERRRPGGKLQKISVNAGNACPNQDGTLGHGGCTYCANSAFSPAYTLARQSITEQLHRGRDFFARKYPKMRYLAYFQSFTSTHTSVEQSIANYEEALRVEGVEGLVVSTRPDCMPLPLLDYLHSLTEQGVFVLVEYGVESTNDETLVHIHRHHTYQQAVDTIQSTALRGIPIGVHMILGLPFERPADYRVHAERLSELPISLIKLHQLQILRGTEMAREFAEHPHRFAMPTADEYAEQCLDFVRHLREDIWLDRFVAQSPPDMLIAPQWGMKNYQFHHLLLSKAQEA